jgi:phosphonate transport system permease protein
MLTRRQVARRILGWLGFIATLVLAITYTRFDPFALIAGSQDLALFGSRVFPPDFSEIDQILELSLESLGIAILGTFLGLLLALPTAVLTAKTTSAPRWIRVFARTLVVSTRAVPGLVFAILFVQVVGPGPTAGILALGMNSIGMMGKLFGDAIDTLDQSPIRALTATGADRVQVFFGTVLPQLFPALVATTLHRLDINFRYSAILGLVGAGGIGLYLQFNIGYFEYPDALAAVVVIVLAVLALEAISMAIRKHVLLPKSASRWSIPRALLGFVGVGTLITGILLSLEIAWDRLASLPSAMADLAGKMVPPDFMTYFPELAEGTLQSVSMALVATFFGALMAIPLGFLAARNVVNFPIRGLARGASQVVRGVPDLILALFLVSALGLGPATGTLVLTIGTLGFLTKFVADSLEEIDTSAFKAMLSSGATRLQAAVATLLPQARPIITAHTFYALDINFRLSALMGIVGAGGIGAAIMAAVEVGDFRTAFAALIIVFLCVLGIEGLSRWQMKK